MANNLLEKIRQTPKDELAEKAAQVEGLGPDDYDNATRHTTFHVNRHWAQVKNCFHWVIFGCGFILAVGVVIGLGVLVFFYLRSVVENPDEVANLLTNIWNIFLVVLATLAIEYMLRKDK